MKYLTLLQLIFESRLDDAIKKYDLTEDDKKFLEAIDPGAQLFQNKYVDWLAKQMYHFGNFSVPDNTFFKKTPEEWRTMFKFFKGFNKDIKDYSLNKFAEETLTALRKSKGSEEIEIIYDDSEFTLVLLKGPYGFRDRYGGKVPWCVASSTAEQHYKDLQGTERHS